MKTVSVRTYLLTFAGLMLLLALTATAAWFPLGAGNQVIALGVAVAKAVLILLYFMHLRVAPWANRLACVVGLLWLGILLALALSDFLTRGEIGVPGK